MRTLHYLAAALCSTAVPALAQTIESAFTDFDLRQCRHIRGKAKEDYGEWRCKGYGGMPVWMAAGDQRVMISFGPRAKDAPAASQTLASFNGEGKRIEWRLARGDAGRRPLAAIMRWSTTRSDEKGEPIRGEVLVVTRMPPGPVCHVGYVDGRANKNADELARELADKHARAFRCGTDERIVLGEQGPGFSKPYGMKD